MASTPTAPLTTAAEKQLHLILRDVCGVRTMDVIETLKPFLTTYAARVRRDAIEDCIVVANENQDWATANAIRALPPGSPSSQTDTGDSNNE